jgi:hypothetical protein
MHGKAPMFSYKKIRGLAGFIHHSSVCTFFVFSLSTNMRFALFSLAIAALSVQQAASLPLHERANGITASGIYFPNRML